MEKFNGLFLRRKERKKGINECKTSHFYIALEKDNDIELLKKVCGKGGTSYISSEYKTSNNRVYIEYKKVIYYLNEKGEFVA